LTDTERAAYERRVAWLAAFAEEVFVCLQQRDPDPIHDAERAAIYGKEARRDAPR